jgi:hypothetical protein
MPNLMPRPIHSDELSGLPGRVIKAKTSSTRIRHQRVNPAADLTALNAQAQGDPRPI